MEYQKEYLETLPNLNFDQIYKIDLSHNHITTSPRIRRRMPSDVSLSQNASAFCESETTFSSHQNAFAF